MKATRPDEFPALRLLATLFAGMSLAAAASPSRAADAARDYPTRPIRLVVNAPPGGGTDILGRMLALRLGEALAGNVVVDNRPGGGGILGTAIVAQAAPDGHTLLMTFTSHVINPALHAKLPYDTLADFAPVAFAASAANVLVVHPALAVRSVAELIALGRARPGELTYASAGSGSSSHLASVLFARSAGIRLTHVPYKGGAPAANAVMSGEVRMLMGNLQSALPHVRSGRLRGLATTGLRRPAAAPDLPTLDESGLRGYEANSWFGLFAPAGTPAAVVARLNGEVAGIVRRSDVAKSMLARGAEASPMDVATFAAFVRDEIAKWAVVVRDAGARVD